jgi:hypothetical protein
MPGLTRHLFFVYIFDQVKRVMIRLNIAYVPADPQLAARCIAYSTDHFGRSARGYLLNKNKALPHVTVAQFDALDIPPSDFFEQVRKVCRPGIEISFDTIYFQSGTGEHEGYVLDGPRR